MCGIAGVFHVDGQPADPEIVEKMTRLIAHRGPDGQAEWVRGAVGLGHRRLSIVDLSERGKQPMSNEDGSVWITFNGEIYNHQGLRSDLLTKGHLFTSQTDTESIVHGYEEYGEGVIQYLNGMFAFAIWDGRKQELFLVRDRLGIKPLFYGLFGDTFLFGSEIKAILAHPACQRELDTTALDLYLSLNYTPAPMTMIRGIRQLEPGQWMRVKANSRELEIVTYWDVDYSQKTDLTFEEAVEQFDSLLHAAVERRLMSDVPLGAFLSGGLDSSAVVACMKNTATGAVKTFSMGFGEASYNEAPYAREVAAHLNTQHFERTVTPDLAAILPKIVWHGEDPLADSSMIPVYYLSQMTREHVTVALAGDGADEILAGYPTYVATRWARLTEFIPRPVIETAVQPLIDLLPVSDAKVSRREKLQRFTNGIGYGWQDAHAVWRQIHSESQKRQILTNGILNGSTRLFDTYRRYYERCQSEDMLDKLLYVDTRFYLPNDMLAKVDRMSMAHGLEARVPFLDYTLVEFAASLPADYKLRRGVGKYILRKSMEKRLPKNTLTRPKAGFNIPVAKWLREELRDLLIDTLSVKNLTEVDIWQPSNIQKMIQEHMQRKRDNGYQLWGLLTFMLWWKQFMEQK